LGVLDLYDKSQHYLNRFGRELGIVNIVVHFDYLDTFFEVCLYGIKHRLIGFAVTQRLIVSVENGYSSKWDKEGNWPSGGVGLFILLLLVKWYRLLL
jgi:hypothetical protein